MLVMLANKHTRNARFLSDPSDCAARGVPTQDALARTPLWSTMMKAFLSKNGRRGPKQAGGNTSGRLAPCPQVLICLPPLRGHHLMVTLLLNRSKVIIQPMKDGDGKRKFKLGPIVTMSCHPWDLNSKQTPHQPTPGPSGIQWLKDLFREPSQHNEPPIPGLGEHCKPHEPEPEVALTQSMEEPFGIYQLTTNVNDSLSHCPQIHQQNLAGASPIAHMIPFVDATHQNEMHLEFWEELNTLLGPALEAYPKEEITRIVSRFLSK
ncbi:hypothetical protein O181_003201 [Austropuccinia psidii MF-1]|uniref:Uncharacterized protein n=1 Tax=Austropuccinia psidii MF-1 TaxID=1389203 RepID=A0A9Q3BDD6_9BASI|nr:hypothetical protein [Austropuccinia psidii MF-1]